MFIEPVWERFSTVREAALATSPTAAKAISSPASTSTEPGERSRSIPANARYPHTTSSTTALASAARISARW